jgi:hypothetical protein
MIMESAPIDRTMCRFLLPHSQENSLLKILSTDKTLLGTGLLTLETRNVLHGSGTNTRVRVRGADELNSRGIAHGSRINVICFHAEGVKLNPTLSGSMNHVLPRCPVALPPAIKFVHVANGKRLLNIGACDQVMSNILSLLTHHSSPITVFNA